MDGQPPTPAPALNIPPGQTAVTISAIDSTLWISGVPTEYMYSPPIPGFGRVRAGCWSFLIEHPSGRKLLYDLGSRKDAIETVAPGWGLKKLHEDGVIESFNVEKHVAEILTENGVGLRQIEGVVWSHWHFDHTGDMSTFPSTTKLVVGEGFKDNFMPGYPVDPNAWTLESDFEGREVVEVSFSTGALAKKIGEFRAYDYFGDGSFYVLNSPGHAIGHVNALARTSVEPPEFIHLCGDSAHHCGEIRPSEYIPLPYLVEPTPLPKSQPYVCPGGVFASILRNGSSRDHILELIDPFEGKVEKEAGDKKYSIMYDKEETMRSVRKVEGFDANENVFTLLAHDWSLKGVIEEWPSASLNDWKKKGWRRDGFWKFLKDFEGAVSEASTKGA